MIRWIAIAMMGAGLGLVLIDLWAALIVLNLF